MSGSDSNGAALTSSQLCKGIICLERSCTEVRVSCHDALGMIIRLSAQDAALNKGADCRISNQVGLRYGTVAPQLCMCVRRLWMTREDSLYLSFHYPALAYNAQRCLDMPLHFTEDANTFLDRFGCVLVHLRDAMTPSELCSSQRLVHAGCSLGISAELYCPRPCLSDCNDSSFRRAETHFTESQPLLSCAGAQQNPGRRALPVRHICLGKSVALAPTNF